MSWARAFNGYLADHTQFLLRPGSAGSPASTPISPDIDEQIEARLAPFMWKAILDTRVLIAEDLGAAPTPLALAQMQCYTRRSAASRTRRGGEVRQPASRSWCGSPAVRGPQVRIPHTLSAVWEVRKQVRVW